MRTVFISGASSGIGRAAALAFARRGDALGLFARRAELLAAVAREAERAGGKALVVSGDVRDEAVLRRAVTDTEKAFGALGVLVANAGVGSFGTVVDTPFEDYRRLLETNFLGMVTTVKAALPGMLARRRGSVVIVGSICGRMGYAGMSAYCAAKFAEVGFTQALRAECRGTGVAVSLVNPGSVRTDFLDVVRRSPAVPAAERLPRELYPEEVALAVVRAAENGRREIILPAFSRLFIRFHDFAPGVTEWLFGAVSRRLKR